MLTLLDAPIEPLLTLAEVKLALRIDTTDDDDYLQSLIEVARQRLDGRDGILGRCLRPQVWRWDFGRFPAYSSHNGFPPTYWDSGGLPFQQGKLQLPLPPTIEVQEISYLDTNNVRTVWDASLWRSIPGGLVGDYVLPVYRQMWPATLMDDQPDTVSVTFRAGYQDLSSPSNEAIPEPIRLAAKLMLGDWYEFRLNTLVGATVEELPNAVMNLLAPYRFIPIA